MTGLDDLPIRDDLRGRTPYGAPQLDVPVRLNTNENSYPVPESVVEAIGKAVAAELRDLNRYPDRDAVALRADLADYLGHGLGVANVWAANGSNEIQQQLLQVFGGPGRSVLGFTPAYSMHPLLALATGTAWRDGHRDADFGLTVEHAVAQVRAHRPDLVFLCSPNNPTGSAVSLETVEAVSYETAGVVIVDESYIEFAREGTRSAVELISRFPRLLVVRSLSRAFGLAGARVGYIVGRPHAIEYLQYVRMPYHLSALAQAAARAALAHASVLREQVEAVKQQRDRLVAGLRELGLSVPDSDANFVLFGGFKDEKAVWRFLLDRGVLVRDVGVPSYLRVSAGTAEEVETFLQVMGQLPDGI